MRTCRPASSARGRSDRDRCQHVFERHTLRCGLSVLPPSNGWVFSASPRQPQSACISRPLLPQRCEAPARDKLIGSSLLAWQGHPRRATPRADSIIVTETDGPAGWADPRSTTESPESRGSTARSIAPPSPRGGWIAALPTSGAGMRHPPAPCGRPADIVIPAGRSWMTKAKSTVPADLSTERDGVVRADPAMVWGIGTTQPNRPSLGMSVHWVTRSVSEIVAGRVRRTDSTEEAAVTPFCSPLSAFFRSRF
jgi:hypothetical protein